MTYSDIRARARENLRGNWGVSVATAFVAVILGGLISGTGINLNVDEEVLTLLPETVLRVLLVLLGVGSALTLVHLILGGVVQLGYAHFLLKQHDGKEHSVKDLFSQFDRFGTGFAQYFLTGLYILLWTLLLIIPGFIKAFSYAMTPFILEEHPELTANQAITRSRELMDGHKGDLFMLELTFIGWDLLCLLTLGIGTLWLNPYKNAAYAVFYRELTAKNPETHAEF